MGNTILRDKELGPVQRVSTLEPYVKGLEALHDNSRKSAKRLHRIASKKGQKPQVPKERTFSETCVLEYSEYMLRRDTLQTCSSYKQSYTISSIRNAVMLILLIICISIATVGIITHFYTPEKRQPTNDRKTTDSMTPVSVHPTTNSESSTNGIYQIAHVLYTLEYP